MIFWRISNYATLDGTGGLLAAGRWHSKGRAIVYCASNPAAALLEVIVHTGEFAVSEMPVSYKYLKIEVPDSVVADTVTLNDLPVAWPEQIKVTRQIGDGWLVARRAPLLHVPSVIVPETMNALLNPNHADSNKLRILNVIDYPLDRRLN